jgi:hypothetical protein
MLIQHPAIKKLLRFRRARRFEMHLPELLIAFLRLGVLNYANADGRYRREDR